MADKDALPIIRGTLDLLVLKALTWNGMHGYGIASWLERNTEGVLEVDDSAMYQSLHRLEERGRVEAEWRMTENKREARYYRITPEGREYLKKQSASWVRYSTSVTTLLTMPKTAMVD